MKLHVMLLFTIVFFVSYSNLAFAQPYEVSNDNSKLPQKTKILLTIPSPDTFPFWYRVKQFASVISKSLNVELYILNFKPEDRNRFQFAKALEETITTTFKPDFIISMFWMNGESLLFDIVQRYKIPLITFNSSLINKQYEKVGKPGEKYSFWLAHIAPDDIALGRAVAEQLIATYKQNTMIAISGDRTSNSSNNRIEGLKQIVKVNKQTKLLQIVRTDWSKSDAKDKAIQLLDRYKDENINVVWTAGDFIAHGAIEAIKESGLKSGKDLLVAGIDWNEASFALIRNDEMAFSLGGHFVEAGIAVVLANDYIKGIDFTKFTGRIIQTKMHPLTKDNIDDIESLLDYSNWQDIDFKMLSKYYHPELTEYVFELEEMLHVKN